MDDVLERESFERLLVAIDERGRAADDEESYYRDILLLLLREGPFSAAALWTLNDGEATLKAIAPSTARLSTPPSELVTRLMANQVVESAHDVVPGEANGSHGSRFLAGSRIVSDQGIALDLTLQSATASDRLRRLLEALAELIGVAETRLRYQAVQRRTEALAASDRIIQQFHSGESLRETALLVAAGLQDALGYDRCWICRKLGRSARVIVTSAPGDVARRQKLVRAVEELATVVFDGGRELEWKSGESSGAAGPPVLRLAEEGSARRVTVIPLARAEQPVVAVAVLEQFSAISNDGEAARRRTLEPHAALALARAIDLERRTWRNLWIEQGSSAWVRRGIIAGILLTAAAFLAMPVPFNVEAEGRLMPGRMRSVFAPADGNIADVHVRHGQSVSDNELLLNLRSPELDLDRERVIGQIRELQAKLASIQVLRTQGRSSSEQSPGDLSAQEEQLRVALAGAEEQGRLVAAQLSQLAVKSPIAGIIDRWDLDSLDSRPVVRGQHLCDVLDVQGGWKVDLRIPDRKAAAVLAARMHQADLPVRFVLRSDPRNEDLTQLEALGERTELDDQGKLTIHATAPLREDSTLPRRAGATVVARIDCGRKSRAYVWFHELWDTLALWRL